MGWIYGTSGPDVIIATSPFGYGDIIFPRLGADTITTNQWLDVIEGTPAELDGDHLTNLLPGTRIQIDGLENPFSLIYDAPTGMLSWSGYSSNTQFQTAGTLYVTNRSVGYFTSTYIPADPMDGLPEGIQLTFHRALHVENDFNGDGHSDILWRNSSGYVTEWLSSGNGGFTSNGANAGNGSADASWTIVATGDFDGDGYNDVLWRNTSGYVTEWRGSSNGGFTSNESHAGTGAVDNSWQVVGAADFDGDGRTDILWRNSSGFITDWLGTWNGGFTPNNTNAGTAAADNNWQVAGTGDFNGDGFADILWRNATSGYVTEWLGTPGGGFTSNDANAGNGSADASWQIVGTADINGDHHTDVLWRNISGYVTDWLGTDSGGFTPNGANAGNGSADSTWQVASLGDFNGDGYSDILWRNAGGYVTEWLGNDLGGFTSNQANAGNGSADATWHVQDPFL